MAEIKNGRIMRIFPCLLRKKLKLLMVETNRLSESETIGIASVLIPAMAMSAV